MAEFLKSDLIQAVSLPREEMASLRMETQIRGIEYGSTPDWRHAFGVTNLQLMPDALDSFRSIVASGRLSASATATYHAS